MTLDELAEYEGPVTNVDPPNPDWAILTIYCRYCVQDIFDWSTRGYPNVKEWPASTPALPRVHLDRVRFAYNPGYYLSHVYFISVWVGQCPKCGRVYQTWIM
jgi:hypothetical protein